MRYVEIVHAIPGRIRLRIAGIRKKREEAAKAARSVALVAGVAEIRVRPFTGTFIVSYDPARADAERIAGALRDAAGAVAILSQGERPPREQASPEAAGSRVGRAVVEAFREVNEDLLRRTGGGVDLAVLATATLLAVSGAEVVARKKLSAPPWFNLVWWGFQTFRHVEAPDLE
ncbi:MAG TPA: hypothetical protein VM753_14260 [Anaeromyxobacter sp.]|nr:hypothetical protein [Anaeromyxobacter sp.]